MGREFELKYGASPEQQAAIAAKFGEFETIAMATTYYDTPDGALSARHITLRLRTENGTAVCTVKTPCPDGGRGEWELPCENITDAIPLLCKLGAPAELSLWTANGVVSICGARFTRRAKQIQLADCTVELALDEGILTGAGKEIPLCEIEVEFKSGSEAAAVVFANVLAAEFNLKPENKSKFRRARELAEK